MDILIILLIIFIPIVAQTFIVSLYYKYQSKANSCNLSGQEVARKILDKNNFNNIYIIETFEKTFGYYNQKRNTIRFSKEVFNDSSISSLSIAANCCMSLVEYKNDNRYLKLRETIYPLVKMGMICSYLLILFGLVLNIKDLINYGIAILSIGLLFAILSLPMEIDLNKKAFQELEKNKIIKNKEKNDVKIMLNILSYKYVANTITCIADVIEFLKSLINTSK